MKASVTPSDEELINNAKQGSLESFTLLYERYLPIVYNRVRFAIPQQDVEDVTQEVFIAVLKSLHSFRGDSRFGAWLRTVTARQIANYYRQFPQLNIETPLDENSLSTSRFFESEDAFLLRQAFRKLSIRYQEILLLRFMDGLQFKEIAHTQGQSLEAVKSLFRRAVDALYKQFNAGEQE